MNRGNHSKIRGSKALVIVLAVVLLVGASVGGTIAWLTAKTPVVTNTFTSAKLFANPTTDFTLWEHEAVVQADGSYVLNDESEVISNEYELLPGVDIPKNPTVDVVNLLEDAYLYITVAGELPTGLTYSVDEANWEPLDGYTGVWVYTGEEANDDNVIPAAGTSVSFTANILTNNEITVATTYNGAANGETLTFNAYMAQATGNGDDAAAAWANTFATP